METLLLLLVSAFNLVHLYRSRDSKKRSVNMSNFISCFMRPEFFAGFFQALKYK